MIDIINFLELLEDSTGVSIDSRKTKENEIFIGLKGENTDGGFYYKEALRNGAKACLLNENLNEINLDKNLPIFFVKDTFLFIKEVANLWRQNFEGKIIAISGSNGKTTTKNLLTNVFKSHYNTNSTLENENNFLGVILTMIRTKLKNDFLIVEIGTNHFGEIKEISEFLKPDTGIITNLGMEHLEFFNDLEGVAKEELDLARYLKKHKKFIFAPKNDLFLQEKLNKENFQVISYDFKNTDSKLNVSAGNIYLKSNPETPLSLKGEHNAMNISAVFCIAEYFKIPAEKIKKSLLEFNPTANRSELVFDKKLKTHFLFDAYNANPSSMKASMSSFMQIDFSEPRILVLGAMKEMGKNSKEVHKEIVLYARNFNVQKIYLIGSEFKESFSADNDIFSYYIDYLTFLESVSLSDFFKKAVFVKGSKSSNLRFFREDYLKLG